MQEVYEYLERLSNNAYVVNGVTNLIDNSINDSNTFVNSNNDENNKNGRVEEAERIPEKNLYLF